LITALQNTALGAWPDCSRRRAVSPSTARDDFALHAAAARIILVRRAPAGLAI
jgi:hypothetical protein